MKKLQQFGYDNIRGLMQKRRNLIANIQELHRFYIKPSIGYPVTLPQIVQFCVRSSSDRADRALKTMSALVMIPANEHLCR